MNALYFQKSNYFPKFFQRCRQDPILRRSNIVSLSVNFLIWTFLIAFNLPLKLLAQTKEIELSYKENFVCFAFIPLDYKNPNKNQYAYKLEGFDKDWIYCGTRRYASYTNLHPGNYVFRIKSLNSSGIWNEDRTSFMIMIHPPFWRTGWFYLLAIGFLIITASVLYSYWVKHKAQQMLEMERVRMLERQQIRRRAATNFHDELGQESTKISLYSEIIKKHFIGSSPEFNEYVNKICVASKSLTMGMRDFNWLLDPEKDSLYECAIHLKDFGDELFDKTGIAFRVQGISKDLENINISMEYRRQLTLIFKEGMNNILRHAYGKNVTLKITMKPLNLQMTLSDDGKGFDKKLQLNGNGLRNMKDRAKKVQGELKVISKPGKGTTIEFIGQLLKIGDLY